jgi:hypothetical protein
MRALTAKEQKLLFLLIGALFVLLNIVGLQAFLNRQRLLQSNIGWKPTNRSMIPAR